MVDTRNRPLITRLLANRNLRARYLAHMRTIADEALDWKTLGPIFEKFRQLIAEDVLADTRNLSDFAEFFDSDIAESAGGGPGGTPPGIKRFVEERRQYLLKHADLAKPQPAILSVTHAAAPRAGSPVEVVAEVGQQTPAETVILYYAVGRGAPFQRTAMKAGAPRSDAQPSSVRYTAAIPAASADDEVYYYVEARAEESIGTTTFNPSHAAMGALHYRVAGAPSDGAKAGVLPVVLNELMASNTRIIRSPQGQFEDWIELANVGQQEVDLSGLHLTDDKAKLDKWTFPAGTRLGAGEYLIVWADGKPRAKPGLHANFKLSVDGERLLLIDRDARGSVIIDAVEFGPQRSDVAYGRLPDGKGMWQPLPPTPGKPNSDK
jgi:hypothetical protein